MIKLFDRTRYDLIHSFRGFLRLHQWNLIALGALKMALLLTGLASPYLFKLLIDRVMIQKDTSWLVWICVGFAGIYFVETIIQYVQRYISNRYSLRFSFDLRRTLWKKIMRFDVQLQKKFPSGDLKNRLDGDVDLCESFVIKQIVDYGYFWLLAIINGIVLLAISWKLALFGFFMVPLSFWMVRWLGNGVKRTSEGYRQEWGGYEGWLQNSLGNWKEVKALGIERRQSIEFTRYWKSLSKLFFKRQMFWYGNRSFIAFKDFFITRMNLYFLGGLFIFSGDLTVGSLIVFMKYYEQFFTGINSINNLDIELKRDTPALQRVTEVLQLPTKKRSFYVPTDFKGEIRFSNVSFIYDELTGEGVKDINLNIAPGEKIAIVGRSGSGKSTLVNLLSGVYSPQKGTIFIDDVPIEEYDPLFLRKQMGIVLQESYVFNLSVEENLKIANPKATVNEIVEACLKANIHNQIEMMTNGYGTLLGEKGVNLSGGQRQRILIARSILNNSKIIIFDEATSQLDGESEQIINANINGMIDKTVVIVAHRHTSISYCNRNVVLDQGRIVETN